LGVLKCEEAVRTISSFADSENPDLRKTALAALANIGHPRFIQVAYEGS
jgi:HEAT repeat protein